MGEGNFQTNAADIFILKQYMTTENISFSFFKCLICSLSQVSVPHTAGGGCG